MISRNVFCVISNSLMLLIASKAGKSFAGNVANEKRLRPDCTKALVSLTVKLINYSLGNDLQISSNFLAGTVISPGSSMTILI